MLRCSTQSTYSEGPTKDTPDQSFLANLQPYLILTDSLRLKAAGPDGYLHPFADAGHEGSQPMDFNEDYRMSA